MRVGLLGGSFNPAHRGHLHISQTVMGKMGLDWVWWLVTPQNPLKSPSGTPLLAERLKKAISVSKDCPKIVVTGIEGELGTQFTYESLRELKRLFPKIDFFWLMGSDCLIDFHRWHRWVDFFSLAPVVVFDRPYRTRLIGSQGKDP